MGLIDAINISHSYGDKALYRNASFSLYKGEHMGLVGKNGAGKTTLLNTLIGKITPDKGEIYRQKGINVGFLDQHAVIDDKLTVLEYLRTAFKELYKVESELNSLYEILADSPNDEIMDKVSECQNILEHGNFYKIETTILKTADGLGITALGLNNLLSKLSGGQRAKVILAKILIEKPDVLLLDEPTNFLDKEHVDWLTNYLQKFSGAFITISHNFDFLDKVSNCICDIEFYDIKKYSGNFSKFIELKNFSKENYIREYTVQQKQIKKYEEYIAKNIARASTANMAKSRQKSLDKIERITPPETLPKPNFQLVSLPISNDNTLVVKDLVIGYQHPLLPKLNFTVDSRKKIVITGFNGIGKTTLLKTLNSEILQINGNFTFANNIKIGYFEQDTKWKNDGLNSLQLILSKFPHLNERQARQNLAQCGLKSKSIMQPIYTLSGGEQAKIKICILTLTKNNFLILDEPTNHLDSSAKEILQEQLVKWEGSILLVSHELSFYKNWIEDVIDINKYLK